MGRFYFHDGNGGPGGMSHGLCHICRAPLSDHPRFEDSECGEFDGRGCWHPDRHCPECVLLPWMGFNSKTMTIGQRNERIRRYAEQQGWELRSLGTGGYVLAYETRTASHMLHCDSIRDV